MLNSKKILASLLALIVILAGCKANKEMNENKETERSKEKGEEARTLTDAMGHEVTIPVNPERVIASYLEDHLVALGIRPIAQWTVNDGASVQSYLQDDLRNIPTIPHDLPYEVVTSFAPDLLIMESAEAVEGGKFEQYSKISPTYVLETEVNSNWRDKLLKVGEVFDKREEAELVLAEYDERAEALQQKLQDAIGEESAAAIWLVNNNFFIVGEHVSSGAVLYEDLGLTTPNIVQEISSTATSNWSAISLEKLAELDADHIFLINSDKGNGTEMLKDPVWKEIPAVKNNNIYEFEAESAWLYSGPIANRQIMDDVIESLIKD